MPKVVINRCFGGFSISLEAARHMAAAGSKRAQLDVADHEKTLLDFAAYKATGKVPDGRDDFYGRIWDISIKYDKEPDFHGYGYVNGMDGGYERDDPLLVAAVEALGKESFGRASELAVVEIPDSVEWEIDEYDGKEHIAEKHRTWR